MPEIEPKGLPGADLEMVLETLALDQPGAITPLRGHIAWLVKSNLIHCDLLAAVVPVVAAARSVTEICGGGPTSLLALADGIRRLEGKLITFDKLERENAHG